MNALTHAVAEALADRLDIEGATLPEPALNLAASAALDAVRAHLRYLHTRLEASADYNRGFREGQLSVLRLLDASYNPPSGCLDIMYAQPFLLSGDGDAAMQERYANAAQAKRDAERQPAQQAFEAEVGRQIGNPPGCTASHHKYTGKCPYCHARLP